LTKSQPKEMLPVGSKPVVQYVVEELIRCGVHRMLFVTGPGKTAIENHFDINVELIDHLRQTGKEELLAELSFEREEADYFYTRQRRQLGLGHAVLCAEPFVKGQRFVIALGDSIIGLQAQSRVVERMIEVFEQHDVYGVIAFQEVAPEAVVRYGIAEPTQKITDADTIFELKDLVEKPGVEEAPSRMAVAARYVFSPDIFGYLKKTEPGKGGEIQLTDAIRMLIADRKKVLGIRIPPRHRRYDIGNFQSYFETFFRFALADPDQGPAIREMARKIIDEPPSP
jgi:UTP--glucose-1-phosphate uridylyltransferase